MCIQDNANTSDKNKSKIENHSCVTSSGVERSISKLSKSTLEEAQRFFNYFESNGWLVGGRTKMKDWKAAARNWMLNTNKFINDRHPVQATIALKRSTEGLNPNHLHVSNHKNYGEAL